MIKTKGELLETDKNVIVISKELATEIFNETGLMSIGSKLNKEKIVLTKDDIKEVKNEYSVEPISSEKKKVGRPRIEEDNPEGLEGKDLLRYKNRIWKRNSRNRLKKN